MKTQLVCYDCGASYTTAGDKNWHLEKDPANITSISEEWFHDCDGSGSRHRTREIKVGEDIVITIPKKAVPKKTRPKGVGIGRPPNTHSGRPVIKSTRKPWGKPDSTKSADDIQKDIVSIAKTAESTEDKTMFKAPFEALPHSYGRKIVDADNRIVGYVTKPKKGQPDHLDFVIDALTQFVPPAEETPAEPVETKAPKREAELPVEVEDAFDVIKDHILEGDKNLHSIMDAVDNAR